MMALIFVLGMFLESISIILITTPVILPAMAELHIDPVWYGVLLVINLELAQITPPVGMNLYVVQGVRGEGNIIDVIYGVLPFLLIMLFLVALLWFYPAIAMWLPNMMGK